jgi:Tol biopolymer transport system component
LTDDWIIYKAWPDWSPGGRAITYTSFPVMHLFSVPIAGGTPSQLTEGTRFEQNARWSPDSSQLVFASDDDGQYDLYVMPAHGGTARRLTTSEGQESLPGWSPDNKTLIYSMSFDHMKICTANVDSL